MSKSHALLPLLIAAALGLAACTPNTGNEASTTPAAEPVEATAPATDTATTLAGYYWHLESAVDAQGQRIDALFPKPDSALVFQFAEGRLGVRGGCNNQSASFELGADGSLTTTRPVSTMMACDQVLMQADAAVGELLDAGSFQVEAAGGDAASLKLTAANGTVLTFKGQPTPQTRFGGPGERVFLEVAPERVACNHPLIPDFKCLQVREITFDENGLRSGEPGEWQPLYEEIEGFTHVEGQRNVLRLDRYTRETTPADASSIVYVLDMVVESEVVKP